MNLSEVTRIEVREVRSLGPAEEPDRNRFGFRKEHRSPSPGIGGRVTRLRVVFTCPYSVRKVTGIGVFVSDLMRSLSHYGHEGWVVCPDGPGILLQDLPEHPSKLVEIPVQCWPFLRDVILGLGTARTLLSCRRLFDVIHAQQPHLQTVVAIVVGRICGRKSVTTLHGRLPRPTGLVRLRFLHFLEWFVLRYSGEIAYVSDQTKKDFDGARGKAIANGADEGRFRYDQESRRWAREEIGVRNEFVVLFLSRWAQIKGVREVLDAFAKVRAVTRNVRLLLVGGGLPEEERFVQEHVRELSIETATTLLGVVTDRRPWFQAADLYLLPSHNEGLPLALLEAMSVGLPCIVTPVGGMHDVIRDGVNGFVVPEGDASALAHTIIRCIQDEVIRNAVGRQARETVEARFNLDRMARDYMGIYRSLREIGGRVEST